jgi:hypothetical protein
MGRDKSSPLGWILILLSDDIVAEGVPCVNTTWSLLSRHRSLLSRCRSSISSTTIIRNSVVWLHAMLRRFWPLSWWFLSRLRVIYVRVLCCWGQDWMKSALTTFPNWVVLWPDFRISHNKVCPFIAVEIKNLLGTSWPRLLGLEFCLSNWSTYAIQLSIVFEINCSSRSITYSHFFLLLFQPLSIDEPK